MYGQEWSGPMFGTTFFLTKFKWRKNLNVLQNDLWQGLQTEQGLTLIYHKDGAHHTTQVSSS